MEQFSDDIHQIAQEEIAIIKKDSLREKAEDLLARWMNSTHDDFCKTVILPEIAALHKKDRRVAKNTLRTIKGKMADRLDSVARMHRLHRQSADNMHSETLETYELIERIGRGVVFFGSSRTKPEGKYYEETRELGREIGLLLGSPI